MENYMKKISSALVCVICLATIVNADFTRVEIGGGAWQQTPTGAILANNSTLTGSDSATEDGETQGYVWAFVKHPVPIIPNLRLEYVGINSTGTASGTFFNFTAPVGSASSLTMIQYDVIPYYNILDNTFWISIDLGIDVKIIESEYIVNGVSTNASVNTSYTTSSSTVIPLLYARARVQIPATNIGIESDAKYVSYDSNTIYDARVKVDYTLGFIPAVQPALEVGYRIQHIETNGNEDVKIDMEFSGVYVGLMLRF